MQGRSVGVQPEEGGGPRDGGRLARDQRLLCLHEKLVVASGVPRREGGQQAVQRLVIHPFVGFTGRGGVGRWRPVVQAARRSTLSGASWLFHPQLLPGDY